MRFQTDPSGAEVQPDFDVWWASQMLCCRRSSQVWGALRSVLFGDACQPPEMHRVGAWGRISWRLGSGRTRNAGSSIL